MKRGTLISRPVSSVAAFVTLPLVYTHHPERPGHNLGMYRMHVHDRRTTGMHWQIGKGGGYHYAVAERRNEALPVTVFLGGPPALILSAIAPLPENLPELMLASLISGERLKLSEGPWPHPLVANAEIALIGEVPPHVRRPEGPFGDHYGYYSLRHDYPVFNVKQIARRRDAMFPATVVGVYEGDAEASIPFAWARILAVRTQQEGCDPQAPDCTPQGFIVKTYDQIEEEGYRTFAVQVKPGEGNGDRVAKAIQDQLNALLRALPEDG